MSVKIDGAHNTPATTNTVEHAEAIHNKWSKAVDNSDLNTSVTHTQDNNDALDNRENEEPSICEDCLDRHAQDLCWAVTREPLTPEEFYYLSDHDVFILITVSQYVTDACLDLLERRGKIEIDPEHGPIIPYASDHRIETILTREASQPA